MRSVFEYIHATTGDNVIHKMFYKNNDVDRGG